MKRIVVLLRLGPEWGYRHSAFIVTSNELRQDRQGPRLFCEEFDKRLAERSVFSLETRTELCLRVSLSSVELAISAFNRYFVRIRPYVHGAAWHELRISRIMAVKFDWDPVKAAANLKNHNISFEQACDVFKDWIALDELDDREATENIGTTAPAWWKAGLSL
jgi:hypothetical protein